MFPGPVFNAELLTTARRFRYYAIRFGYGLFLLYFIWQNDPNLYSNRYYYGRPGNQAGLTIQEMAAIGQALFRTYVIVQGVAILLLTPAFVAGVVAEEKRRKTLHYLLASRLSSAEIILDKLGARLLHVGVYMAIGLPIVSLLSLFGGVDPRLIVLSFAATMTTAFFLAALAILISTLARRPREAITVVYLLELVWLFVPTILRFTLPMASPFWRGVHQFINPLNEWIAPSSPFALLLLGTPVTPGGPNAVFDTLAWMMGLQAAYGVLFVTLAIVRLRPGFRNEGDTQGPLGWLGRATRGRRFLPRPACGDDAMLWKERYVSRTGAITKILAGLIILVAGGLLAYYTIDFAAPAFSEVYNNGYGAATGYNNACTQFNTFLRIVGTALYVLWVLGVASGAASGLAHEREEDTWTSLIATPLSGLEIIRAKMFGALWATRWMGFVLLTLWLIGLAAGAVHPLGFVAVVLESAIFLGFADALGTTFSLKARSSGRALVATIAVLILLNGGYMMCCIPLQPNSPIIALGCTPFLVGASLLPYEEVRDLLTSGEIYLSHHYGDIAFTCFAGSGLYLAAAAILTVRVISRFDEEIDRPRRLGLLPPFPVFEKKPKPDEGQDEIDVA